MILRQNYVGDEDYPPQKNPVHTKRFCRCDVSPPHVAASSLSFFSGIVERAKRKGAWKSPHARKARRGGERGRVARRVSPFSRRVIFTRAWVSLALLSLRENEGLLV